MKRLRALAAGLIGACLLVLPAAAQPQSDGAKPANAELPKNPMVQIKYLPPRSGQYQEIYERVQKFHVLELLQIFLSPLQLPKPISVGTAECGARDIPFVPGEPVVICYEFIREIEQLAPPSKFITIGPREMYKSEIIIGAAVNGILNKVAYAVLDMLEIPVWGRMEEAADTVAALVMLEFRHDDVIVWATLAGTSWVLAQRGFSGFGTFSVLGDAESQRFYNYACMALGADPAKFRFFFDNGDLPKSRAERCFIEYRKFKRAFVQTIMPHVDQAKLKQVRDLNWAAQMQLPEK
jgi:hypothetical protein